MLRATKSFVVRLATDACAHRVLIALVDAVADSSLIASALLPVRVLVLYKVIEFNETV